MARTTTEADTARALGCNVKTLSRYRERTPPVPHVMRNGRPFYDPAEVRAYQVEHGLGVRPGEPPPAATAPPAPAPAPGLPPPAFTSPPDGGATHLEQGARAAGAKAQAASHAMRAKEQQRQAKVREGMADLGLGQKIRSAKTEAEVLSFVQELAALQAEGKVLPGDARALRETATEVRQTLKLMARSQSGPEALERATVVTSEALPLIQAFKGITDKARRQRVMAFVQAVAEEDRALGPRPDTGEPQADVA